MVSDFTADFHTYCVQQTICYLQICDLSGWQQYIPVKWRAPIKSFNHDYYFAQKQTICITEKRQRRWWAPSADSDQPAHLFSLINDFTGRYMRRWRASPSLRWRSRLWSAFFLCRLNRTCVVRTCDGIFYQDSAQIVSLLNFLPLSMICTKVIVRSYG